MEHGKGGVLSRRRFIVAGSLAGLTPLLGMSLGSAPARLADVFGFPPADSTGVHVKSMVFPVEGPASWVDTYGACRDGCSRHHEGQDLFGRKGQHLVACVDGTIVTLQHSTDGNSLSIRSSADGWYYRYLHLNDDSPGTDDGRNLRSQAFASGIAEGVRVYRGQHIAYLGDSGNAESTVPHLHFEIRKPASSVWQAQAVNPSHSLTAAQTPSSGRVDAPSGVPPMRLGDRGVRVTALQLALNVGAGSTLQTDGGFGSVTLSVLRGFQRANGLVDDGVYGAASQSRLQAACDGGSAASGPSLATRPPAASGGVAVRAPLGYPAIRPGQQGATVAALQTALNTGTGTQLAVDGKFGPATAAALRSFQRSVGIRSNGVYGPRSQFALQVACNKR